MGTNYYLIYPDERGRIKDLVETYPALQSAWDNFQVMLKMCLAEEELNLKECIFCGEPFWKRLHIGKSSAGWVFALHVYPPKSTRRAWWPDVPDLDAWRKLWYHPSATIEDEYAHIVSAQEMESIVTEGRDGLQRSVIDGQRCIGHGEGSWDLHMGLDDSW